jgi:hypothetical protein
VKPVTANAALVNKMKQHAPSSAPIATPIAPPSKKGPHEGTVRRFVRWLIGAFGALTVFWLLRR